MSDERRARLSPWGRLRLWAWEWCAHWAFNARDKHEPGSPEWHKADRWVRWVFSW